MEPAQSTLQMQCGSFTLSAKVVLVIQSQNALYLYLALTTCDRISQTGC